MEDYSSEGRLGEGKEGGKSFSLLLGEEGLTLSLATVKGGKRFFWRNSTARSKKDKKGGKRGPLLSIRIRAREDGWHVGRGKTCSAVSVGTEGKGGRKRSEKKAEKERK